MLTKIKKSKVLVLCVLGLCIFGMFMIYSASCYSAKVNYGDAFHFVKKQLFGFVLGIGLFFLALKVDYHRLVKIRWYIIGGAVILLVLVFVPFIGISSNGARRWIGFGGLTLQSSEVAKFAYVIFVACYMSKEYKKIPTFQGMIVPLLVGGCICLLVLLEPNLSVTLCIGCVMLCMLLVGGIRMKHLLMLSIPALLLVPILIIIEPYRLQRLTAFLNPWGSPKDEGFQLIQSLYSLGAGGWFGLGYLGSRQKYLFLPFSESDFILSIIGEEFGFVGIVVLCIAYLVVIKEGIKIALHTKDRLGAYMSFGIVCVIAIQTLINFAVVTGSIPPTGIPLPFISAGGTSLSVFLGGIGLLVSIAGQEEKVNVSVPTKKQKMFFKKIKLSKNLVK